MSAACFDVCVGFRVDEASASAVERPFAFFKDVGNSSGAREHLARLSDSLRSGFLGRMDVRALISSDLESPPKEETTMGLQKPDVNNSGLMEDEEQHQFSNFDEIPGINALPHLDLGKTSKDQQSDASNWFSHSQECTATLEYGLKLGYAKNRILAVLRRRGSDISRDELLKELTTENSQSSACGLSESAFAWTPGHDEGQTIEDNPSPLRPIIIDGSNVAMSHGNKKVFSCRGIEIAVDWFKQRGHKEITVFVPQWRKENTRQVSPITNQEILSALERDKIVVFTPSRRVNNKRIVCYDDRYILKLAVDNGGIVVSNDNYRDLLSERPEFKKVIEERLLMYSFVNDRFMPPDDPLGRHGPKLDNFLKMNPASSGPSLQPCPYAKKCTYGNKCRFYHPGRPQRQVVAAATQQIANASPNRTKDHRQRGGVGGNIHETPAFDRLNLGGPNMLPSRSPSELVDLSPVAISLLSGGSGNNQYRSGAGGGLGRRSLPLPWPSGLSVYHRNLRSVQSDPYAGCSGHMAVARELYAGNCRAEQKLRQAACDQGTRSDVPWTEDTKTDESEHKTRRHAALCRKPSVGAGFEKSAIPTQKVPPFGGAVLVSANGGLPEKWNNGSLDLFSEHDHLSRMHSEPLLCQKNADEKDLATAFAESSSSRPRPQQKRVLHRVNTSPLARDDTMTSFHARGGRDFLLPGGNAPTGAFVNPFGDSNWMTGASPCQAKHSDGFLSEFSPADRTSPFVTATDLPSRNLASFTSVQHSPSTFHFGLNSSYRFVPAPCPNIVVPPRDACRVPPGFSAENSGGAKNELFMRLCLLFDPDDVHRVMTEHPDKVDIKSLCGHLLQLDQQN